ncbi:GNAT family N-acetyltransferase [Nocardia noduli]|uniref:GNAT family N-acetyltransferase n=1 Tax=Nocardia noduli TaxID=2815722 RepID=UPI001C220ABD|nr:GNAT family N-acetyltransferase [Nocardia noduli]
MHFVAVDEAHRRGGVGAALVSTAIATARTAGVALLYGQFTTSDRGLARFYSGLGFDISPPDRPLDFTSILGISAGPAPMRGETFFTRWFYDATR